MTTEHHDYAKKLDGRLVWASTVVIAVVVVALIFAVRPAVASVNAGVKVHHWPE